MCCSDLSISVLIGTQYDPNDKSNGTKQAYRGYKRTSKICYVSWCFEQRTISHIPLDN